MRFLSLGAFQLIVLTLAHMTVDLYGGMFAPLIPALERNAGISAGVLGMLAGIGGIVVNGIQPLAGLAIHRVRYPWFLMLGPLLAVCIVGIGLTQSLWGIALAVLVSHVGIGIFHPEGLMTAHEVAGTRDHIGVPFFLSGGFFGYALGALVATRWVAGFGFDHFECLAVPGAVLVALLLLARTPQAATAASSRAAGEETAPDAPGFWPLFVLVSLIVASTQMLFVFLTTHLDRAFGPSALPIGGTALFILGLTSAFGSYVWGTLSGRVSTFAIVALAQLLALPLYAGLLLADALEWVVVLSVPLGALMGVYPLVARLARRARGLSAGLRSGLVVGGSWLVGSLPVCLAGWLVDRGLAVHVPLLAMMGAIAAAGVLAFGLYLHDRRNRLSAP